jgi:uncharacterized protein (TIGR03067 family)
MNNPALMRVLGIGSVAMVLVLGGALFLSFSGNREKEQQLAEKKKEIDKLAEDRKKAEDDAKKLKEDEARCRTAAGKLAEENQKLVALENQRRKAAEDAVKKLLDEVEKLKDEAKGDKSKDALAKALKRVQELEATEKTFKDTLATAQKAFDAKLADLDAQRKTAVAETAKLKLGGKDVELKLAEAADQLAGAQLQLKLAKQAELAVRDQFAKLQKDSRDALDKRAALQADLDARTKLLQAKENQVKDLMAVNANLTLAKQNFDKMLEAKTTALKKLEQENAKLTEDAVVAKAEVMAAKARAEDAARQIEVLRARLQKYETIARADDAQLLQGTWRVSQNRKIGNGAGAAMKFIFKGDELILETGGAGAPPAGKFKLNPKATPKTLDWLNPDGEAWAIYSLNNDELTITFSRGKERPTDFTPKTGDWSAYVLQRVK